MKFDPSSKLFWVFLIILFSIVTVCGILCEVTVLKTIFLA